MLAAVAEEGFDRLAAVMQKTLARGKSPRERTPVVRLWLRKVRPALAAAFPRDVRSASSPAQTLPESGYRGKCVSCSARLHRRRTGIWRSAEGRSVVSRVDSLVAGARHCQAGHQRESASQRPLHGRIYPPCLAGYFRRHGSTQKEIRLSCGNRQGETLRPSQCFLERNERKLVVRSSDSPSVLPLPSGPAFRARHRAQGFEYHCRVRGPVGR